MKTIITCLFILCTLTACGQKNQSNTNSQTISWGGKAAVGGYAPESTLQIKDIQATLDGNTLLNLKVTIDMKSLDQENKQLKKHLKEKDFFHVKKYPEAIYELSQPFVVGVDTHFIGNMTIKDKTQTEKIAAQASLENGVITLILNHRMNRIDYGITYNSPSVFEKIKENAIADEIQLKGTIVIK